VDLVCLSTLGIRSQEKDDLDQTWESLFFKDFMRPLSIIESSAQLFLDSSLICESTNFIRCAISVHATHSRTDLLAILINWANSALVPPLPSAMFKQIETAALRNWSTKEYVSDLGKDVVIL
jgi:hypothetical protein